MVISVQKKAEGELADYALVELKNFLTKFTNAEITNSNKADRFFILELDSCLVNSYKLKSDAIDGKPVLYIYAADESELITGVYEALERMGIFFNIDGQVLAKNIDFAGLDNINEVITPFCRNRGIRQHINFPMDISSYHIEEAKEYIKNLARMRMNTITFHSYTGQWHGYCTEDKKVTAGNFFYGQKHIVPQYGPIKGIVRNKKIYCIPEAENIIDDPDARAVFAVEWLNELIDTAKKAGMKVNISIEFPQDADLNTLIKIVRNVLTSYPSIDSIEWITPEGGGEGEQLSLEGMVSRAVELFGDSILENGKLPYMPKEIPDALAGTFSNLKKAVDLYKQKEKIFEGLREIPIQIGVYVTCKETLKVVKKIMDMVLPKNVTRTFLPAHGSLAVADNIDFMDFSENNWQNTLVYSWIEFDGNMYLQQNSCDGIEKLMNMAKVQSKSQTIYGMCMNHWRTKENLITIAYAAECMIKPVSAHEFYRKYADVYKIGNAEILVKALDKLAKLDVFNRDRLFNIGFCYLGCWLAPKGLGWIRGWKASDLQYSLRQYENIICDMKQCLEATSSEKGITWIRFLINRMECSIQQIKCVSKLELIAQFSEDEKPQGLSNEQKKIVIQYCDKAMKYCKNYIDKHAEMIADRGCEGTVVSYYATMPVYIDHIKQYFAYGEVECNHKPVTFDQPPAPDSNFLEQ